MLIKQFHAESKTAVLRTDTYGSNLKSFDELFEEAKKDFLTLMRENVEIKHYGGDRIKGMFGIEFKIPPGTNVPSSYTNIQQLEVTL